VEYAFGTTPNYSMRTLRPRIPFAGGSAVTQRLSSPLLVNRILSEGTPSTVVRLWPAISRNRAAALASPFCFAVLYPRSAKASTDSISRRSCGFSSTRWSLVNYRPSAGTRLACCLERRQPVGMQYWNYDRGSDGWMVCDCPHCPSCGGELYRVHRRFVDRLFSPGRFRFQCESQVCQWIGNLPIEDTSSTRSGLFHGIAAASIVVIVAGVALVLLTMVSTPDLDSSRPSSGAWDESSAPSSSEPSELPPHAIPVDLRVEHPG